MHSTGKSSISLPASVNRRLVFTADRRRVDYAPSRAPAFPMDMAEEIQKLDSAETPIVFQIVRAVVAATLIAIAAWLVGNAALDWLGAPFLK